MNWDTHTLEYVSTLLDANTGSDPTNSFPKTPIQGGKYVLQSAYDPTVVEYNGELWVSFECWGTGMGSVSSCVGPMSAPGPGSTIDLGRTTVVVEGAATPGAGYAASVPKIFVYGGSPYLFFDAFLTGPGTIAQHGVPLEMIGDRLWAKGAGGQSYVYCSFAVAHLTATVSAALLMLVGLPVLLMNTTLNTVHVVCAAGPGTRSLTLWA
jgi:hypothetical protein